MLLPIKPNLTVGLTISRFTAGLAARQDAADALRVPISIVPAGSGNGLCTKVSRKRAPP